MNKIFLIGLVLLVLAAAAVVLIFYVGKSRQTDQGKKTKIEQEKSIVDGNQTEANQADSRLSGSFVIDTEKSVLKWSAQKVLVRTNDHYGMVKIKSGMIETMDNMLSGGKVVVDMMTIESEDLSGQGKENLERHLKSADFFDVEKYPEAVLEVVKVEKVESDNKFNVMANLIIKGVTNVISFPAQIEIRDERVEVEAEFTIDRTRWDIRYGSGKFFDNLGDNVIDDEITFKVKVKADLNR